LEQTRIVLVDMPPLLREIVREATSREPDLEVVREHEAGADLRAAVEQDDPDFLIVGSAEATEATVDSLVTAGRRLRALEVRSDGRESVLYELRPHRVLLGEISPDTLLHTIRTPPGRNTEREP
jgi:DNA-binding NarL/FixJ family response regulator